MTFVFHDLDATTRAIMIEELDRDAASNSTYVSDRLTYAGRLAWGDLLRDACSVGDESTLATNLGAPGGAYLLAREKDLKNGGDKAVPTNAASTLAEGEFNRLYLRALALRAISEGRLLEVYRARASKNPDPASEACIGQRLNPEVLLLDLRANPGVSTALDLPPHPNTGLSARLG